MVNVLDDGWYLESFKYICKGKVSKPEIGLLHRAILDNFVHGGVRQALNCIAQTTKSQDDIHDILQGIPLLVVTANS